MRRFRARIVTFQEVAAPFPAKSLAAGFGFGEQKTT
jgi:hypothetical protein